jgi:hypothetical protein
MIITKCSADRVIKLEIRDLFISTEFTCTIKQVCKFNMSSPEQIDVPKKQHSKNNLKSLLSVELTS